MVERTTGNILEAKMEALVNTVNCVGVMGKGIALQFRQAFPANYKQYRKACKKEEVQPGRMFIHNRGVGDLPRYIINFPTKRHWRSKSRIEDIKVGLEALIEEVRAREITSIAVPPLGCGNGGLDWNVIGPLIEEAFSAIPDVRVLLYEPLGAPDPDTMPVRTKRPNMTRGRALVLHLLSLYRASEDYRSGLLEIQKLAYFLQEAGEPGLKLDFTQQKYGPYAEVIHHVLRSMEGHYIRGYGDRDVQAQIRVLDGALEDAEETLQEEGDAQDIDKRLNHVEKLIEGFETPYGMELLATVHWLMKHRPDLADDLEKTIQAAHSWSERKARVLKPHHIEIAWQRLKEQGWLPEPMYA